MIFKMEKQIDIEKLTDEKTSSEAFRMGLGTKLDKEGLEWLLSKLEKCSDRYIEAENFILEIMEMPWYKRIFIFNKIYQFFETRKKYNF